MIMVAKSVIGEARSRGRCWKMQDDIVITNPIQPAHGENEIRLEREADKKVECRDSMLDENEGRGIRYLSSCSIRDRRPQ